MITVLFADLQVLVTGSLHLVGDVLKLLKRWYKLKTVPSANNTDNPKHSFAHLPNITFSYHIVKLLRFLMLLLYVTLWPLLVIRYLMYVPLRKNKLIYNLLIVKPEKFNFFYEIDFDLGFELISWCSKNLFRLSC